MKKIRIGLASLVVLALTGVTAGGATAATGRGTAAASITLLDVDLGDVQNIKVLSDEGQGTIDPTRVGLTGPHAFGQLAAVIASGALNISVPDPPAKAEAPGTTSGSLDPISFSLPETATNVTSTGLPIPVGTVAAGVVDPLKVEAFTDAAGARAAVGTEVPGLDVLQGLISVRNVNVAGLSANASPNHSTADTGVIGIEDISVLDLSAFLGGLGVGLGDLNVETLAGLLDPLGLTVPTGDLGLGDLDSAATGDILGGLTGLTSVLSSLSDVASCTELDTLTAPLGDLGLEELLGDGGLLASLELTEILDIDTLLDACETAGLDTTVSNVTDTLTTTIDGLLPTAEGVLDSLFSVLEDASLLRLSGVELSALAIAAGTLEGSSATTTATLGTLSVGGIEVGTLDLTATAAQIASLVNDVESTLNGVTSVLGLPNLIDIGILERTASTRTEGAYNVADAGVNVLRVGINPPADLTSVLAPVTSLGVTSVLSGLISGLPVDTGLADGTLASAFGLASLLSQPTTITVGAIRSQSDFTGVAPAESTGGPVSPPVSGELPRTGHDGAWMAALAALALAGAFGLTRSLRKAHSEG